MKVEEQPEMTSTEAAPKRRGFLSRFRRSGAPKKQESDKREPVKSKSRSKESSKRDGAPMERPAPKDMKPRTQRKQPKQTMKILEQPPAAEEAAFSGPPRYDWIDIETAAAIKVQAAYRRLKVMNAMERSQMSTGPIRRRAIRRAQKKEDQEAVYMYDCCGAGLLLDPEVDPREQDRQRFEKQREERHAKENQLRREFLAMKMKKKAEPNVAEGYEIVE